MNGRESGWFFKAGRVLAVALLLASAPDAIRAGALAAGHASAGAAAVRPLLLLAPESVNENETFSVTVLALQRVPGCWILQRLLPLADVEVTAEWCSARRLRTDASGRVELWAPRVAKTTRYEIRAAKPGYANSGGAVTVADVRQPQSVAIFIDTATYNALKGEVDRLRADIAGDLPADVFLYPGNWTDTREIKSLLAERFERDGLLGSILIGDIPTARFELQHRDADISDFYFQDFSDNFVDSDGDGKFEREHFRLETDVTMKDIWCGRIKPPVPGAAGVELLRAYLDRNHDYRTGHLPFDRKMLYFNSIGINQERMTRAQIDALAGQIDDYTGLYETDGQVDALYALSLDEQKSLYLAKLAERFDFAHIGIHGWQTGQWLGGSTSVLASEVRAAQPNVFFTSLESCSNGDFMAADYIAGWFLFAGQGLLVKANARDAFSVGANEIGAFREFVPLSLGITFGEMHKFAGDLMVTHLFGDPTLRLRSKPAGAVPRAFISATDVSFGSVPRGIRHRREIVMRNDGDAALKIRFLRGPASIDGGQPNLEYWDLFWYSNARDEMYRDIEIAPGEERVVPLTFYPRADGPAGLYSMVFLFSTNDPELPYLQLRLRGTAR